MWPCIFCKADIPELFEPIRFSEEDLEAEQQTEAYIHFIHLLAECEGKYIHSYMYTCSSLRLLYVYINSCLQFQQMNLPVST